MSEDRVLGAGSFGVRLRRYRLASGLSQEELAQRAGLSVRALADMERGRTRRPYKRSVRLLAEAMALSELQRLDLDRASRLVACGAPVPSPAGTGQTTPAAGHHLVPHPGNCRPLTWRDSGRARCAARAADPGRSFHRAGG